MSERLVDAAEPALVALLQLVADDEGVSAARACKRLQLSRSELLRALARLGNDPAVGGLGLLELRSDGARDTLWLTDAARTAQAAG